MIIWNWTAPLASSSSAGNGLAKTVPAVIHWNFSMTSSPAGRVRGELVLGLFAEQMGAKQQVAGEGRHPLRARRLRIRPRRRARSGDCSSRTDSTEPSGRFTRTRSGRGSAAPADDVVGGDEPSEAFSEFGQDGVAVSLGEAIGLVEEDDGAFSLANQGGKRLVFRADQVVVQYEDQEVRPRGQLAGFALSLRAALADFGKARRVSQEHGPFDTFQRVGVVFPVAVVPMTASVLPISRPRSALINEVLPAEPVPKTTT